MKMKNIAAVAMAGCMAASLAACGGSASSAATDASSAASTEAATSEATEATGTSANGFTVQLGPNPETLDPALNSSIDGANTIITTFEPLLLIDENNDVVPGQADLPEVSEDGKVYTFHVQEGLLFSDGSPVTAEDWEWTFTRAIETEDSSWHMCVENLDHVECPDDTTVIVYTKEEAASTLANLCIFTLGVQSKAYFEKVGADEYHNGILGTGPYAVSEWKKGEYLTLEANPN